MNCLKIIHFLGSAICAVGVFAQIPEEYSRARQQADDIKMLIALNRFCTNSCNEEFKRDAFQRPAEANERFNRCLSACLENFERKKACITSQQSSKYSRDACTHLSIKERAADASAWNWIGVLMVIPVFLLLSI